MDFFLVKKLLYKILVKYYLSVSIKVPEDFTVNLGNIWAGTAHDKQAQATRHM